MAEMTGQRPEAGSGDRYKRLLVVVDGDGAHLYYTGILLQRLEYTIYTTKSAEEALEIMNISLPSLVLAEVKLQQMGGIEFLRRVKQDPKTRSVPVIVYTLSKDPAVRESALREGAAAYLQKPVDPDLLYAAIQKATESTPRGYIRLNTCLEIIIGDENDAHADPSGECVSALSENGMYVNTIATRPVGVRVPITLFMGGYAIKAEGVVLYSSHQSAGPTRNPGMGIKFVRIRLEDQELIRTFIKKELTRGLPVAPSGK